jgi:hypothetical protein
MNAAGASNDTWAPREYNCFREPNTTTAHPLPGRFWTSLIAGLIEDPEDDFGYGKLTRLGTAASLAAAITVGRHGANRQHGKN